MYEFSDSNGGQEKLAAWIMRFETEQEALSRRSEAGLSTSLLEHRAAHDASVSHKNITAKQKRCRIITGPHNHIAWFQLHISSNLWLRLVL